MLILLIAITFAIAKDLGPTDAHGQSGSFRLLSSFYVLVGESVYHLDPGNAPAGWRLMPYGSFTLPPVAPSSLIALESDVAITDTGEGWYFTGTGPNGWTSAGPIPGAVGVLKTSWGAVKAKYH
jgi:hypothetical protein